MEQRIAVFDDNDKRRDGLELLISLTDGIKCVGTFPDCSNVEFDVENCKPDLVLMDIEMPNINGIEGVAIIKKKYPAIKVLMQTVFEDDDKLFQCIRAGADGYILKKTSPSDLINAIQDTLNGGSAMTPSIARQVLQFVEKTANTANKTDFKLTNREREILSLLVQGHSYKMIAQRCFISLPTVNSHIQHIYEKLQVNTMVEAVTKAIQNKIV